MSAVEPSRYYSPKTSLRQVPALFTALDAAGLFVAGTVNADLGGGRYDMATKWLAARGVRNVVYDPGNRPRAHNVAALRAIEDGRADTATLANVLNVIPSAQVRRELLLLAANVLKPGGMVFVSIYEGDGTGRQSVTAKGWHANMKLAGYLDEMRAVFPGARVVADRIEART